MGQGETNFSYFMGGIALMSTIFSLIAYSRSYLPRFQMKQLDGILQETRQICDKSAVEGLLPNPLKFKYLRKLSMLEKSQERYREQAYYARTLLSQYKALFRGLSMQIHKVYDDADQLRAQVVTTSEETKRRREGILRDDEGAMNDSENLPIRTTVEDLHEDDQKC